MSYPQPTTPDENQPVSEEPTSGSVSPALKGIGLIAAGIVVFIICSLIQRAGGTSMFSTTYYSTTAFMDLLLKVTWWPGWIATVGLIAAGCRILFKR